MLFQDENGVWHLSVNSAPSEFWGCSLELWIVQGIYALANSRYKLKDEGHLEKWNVKLNYN